MNGTTITKTVQPALLHPDRSCRRYASERTTMRIQNQITHAKKMSIVQRTSRNG